MTPKERLFKYFDFARRQSKLTVDEWHEMIHLEETLVDDLDDYERLLKEND